MRVCLVSSYPPMQCGIATFSRDLREGVISSDRPVAVSVLAVGESRPGQRFGHEVVLRIDKQDRQAYRQAAQRLNRAGFDVVCVQHEFGIFGGPEGRAIVDLLTELSCPTVTTLHTILRDPEPHYREALLEVAAVSDHLVAPTRIARSILRSVYDIDDRHVSVIPHGVPDVPFTDPGPAKQALGFDDRPVLLTFGLLNRNKGIETAIQALPEIVASHPDVLYVVLGATHPDVRREEGESYREFLMAMVEELDLQKHVEFHDHYVDGDELVSYLSACDVYVTPYRSSQQIVSGTLAYAVGMGKAVVSTPYPYAQELLADGRGRLVPPDDPQSLSMALSALLGDERERNEMRQRAYTYGREMTWSQVGLRYVELFGELVATRRDHVGRRESVSLPAVNLSYLARLTDGTGTLQHAMREIPDRRYGYTTDDVSRAIIVAVRAHTRNGSAEALRIAATSMSFLAHAQRGDGWFRNEMSYDRRWLDDGGSEDTLGQCLWGLGVAHSESTDVGICSVAGDLFRKALPRVEDLSWPRAAAYAVTGICAFLEAERGDHDARRALDAGTGVLLDLYDRSSAPDWHWFGDDLTYANAKLPHALLLAAQVTGDQRLRSVGLESLDFLLDQTFQDGRFDFVGNEGWYRRGSARARFGQQPIEAGYTIEACLLAASLTAADRYRAMAEAAVQWYLGRNRLGVALYDPETGVCIDGLDRRGPSVNAGAESVICCLIGLLAASDLGGGG